MKKRLLLVFIGVLVSNAFAQINETVSLGTGYPNESYYSLKDGEVKSIARDEWDIAFKVTRRGSSILTNGATGTELYMYENGDTSAWASFDTTGISTWDVLYNSDTSWSVGAFNHNASGFDLGWGNYSVITHFVTADSLYCIKLSNGDYKKLWIEKLASGTYTFKYADLDGQNEVSASVTKDEFTNKNFAYYSLQTGQLLDREPDNTSWDLLFTKYVRNTPSYYGVSGVLSNDGVTVAEVRDTPTETADHTGATFVTNISEIGYDWKKYQGGYTIVEDLTYFVQTLEGDIYKVVFTGFGGSANGNFEFTKELVLSTGAETIEVASLGMFPNPSNGNVNLVFNATLNEDVLVEVFDLTAKVVYTETISTNIGINQHPVDLTSLNAGVYLVRLNNGPVMRLMID